MHTHTQYILTSTDRHIDGYKVEKWLSNCHKNLGMTQRNEDNSFTSRSEKEVQNFTL